MLVELFTSEGCSTCPPADDLLAYLVRRQPVQGAFIVALGEHVDYWNHLGWSDRFSSGNYSARQRDYVHAMKLNEAYTPQVVVDGVRQVLGSDKRAVERALQEAAAAPKSRLEVSAIEHDGQTVRATVALRGYSADGMPDLYAALTDDQDTTMVANGENRGQSLNHVSVARAFKYFGKINPRDHATLSLPVPPGGAKAKMHLVVFAQMPGPGRVVAIASSPV